MTCNVSAIAGMKVALKHAAVLLFGLLISLVAIQKLHQRYTSAQDREELKASLLFVGVPMMAAGSWLLWEGYQKNQAQQQHRLQTSFFQMLQSNSGYITVLQFAMATGLDGRLAKTYLDDRAREFNAVYDVTEEGTISYYFDLGLSQLPPT